jgi:hypothetical protein
LLLSFPLSPHLHCINLSFLLSSLLIFNFLVYLTLFSPFIFYYYWGYSWCYYSAPNLYMWFVLVVLLLLHFAHS